MKKNFLLIFTLFVNQFQSTLLSDFKLKKVGPIFAGAAITTAALHYFIHQNDDNITNLNTSEPVKNDNNTTSSNTPEPVKSENEKITVQNGIVYMPSKEEIQRRLAQCNMMHFDKKTNFSEQLANEKLSPEEIAVAIELNYINYLQDLTKGQSAKQASMKKVVFALSKPALYKTLLSDAPKVLKELEKHWKN